jgi:hypothetical protein
MTDPGPRAAADQPRRLLLDTASGHLSEARKLLAARPPGDHGTAGEEAALLIALAQAEATLSIAKQLRASAGLSKQARKVMDGLTVAVGDISRAAVALRGPR